MSAMADSANGQGAAAAGQAAAAASDPPPSAANSSSNTSNGGRRHFRPQLCRKLFRLKNLGGVQDTEENSDDSELKVPIMT